MSCTARRGTVRRRGRLSPDSRRRATSLGCGPESDASRARPVSGNSVPVGRRTRPIGDNAVVTSSARGPRRTPAPSPPAPLRVRNPSRRPLPSLVSEPPTVPGRAQTPMCECVSTRPGMTTAPPRSRLSAPAGTATASVGPTASILPSRTTSTPLRTGRHRDDRGNDPAETSATGHVNLTGASRLRRDSSKLPVFNRAGQGYHPG